MEVILRGVSGRSFWVFGMGLVWCRWEMVGCGIGGRGRGRMWWGIVREGGCEGGISNVWSHTGQVPSITFHSVNIVRALDHSISPWSAGNANAGPCANIRRAQWSCATLMRVQTYAAPSGPMANLLWRLLWGQNMGIHQGLI